MEMEEVMKYYVAIDIGASSGRHIVGWKDGDELCTKEMYRFPNGVDEVNGTLTWDVERLFREVVTGLKAVFREFKQIESVAIDTWGVDYVLLDKEGKEILPCHAYRDDRTKAAIEAVHSIMPFEELYAHTGIQFQPFNTIYQLYDDLGKGRLEKAERGCFQASTMLARTFFHMGVLINRPSVTAAIKAAAGTATKSFPPAISIGQRNVTPDSTTRDSCWKVDICKLAAVRICGSL